MLFARVSLSGVKTDVKQSTLEQPFFHSCTLPGVEYNYAGTDFRHSCGVWRDPALS